jgi:hypothetical protein
VPEVAGRGRDLGLVLSHDGERPAHGAQQLDVEAAGPARPAVPDAHGARQQEDRQRVSLSPAVVDVGGDAVGESAVPGAHEVGVDRVRRQERRGGSSRLEPVANLRRVRAPEAGGQEPAPEAPLVVAGDLPGDEGREAAGPEAEEDEHGRREGEQPEAAAATPGGPRVAGRDVDAHSVHGQAGILPHEAHRRREALVPGGARC